MNDSSETKEKKILKVRAGEPFKVTLWEDRTHGYSWQHVENSAPVELLSDEYERTINVDTADSGKRTFEFVCARPGRYEILFENRVGWQYTAKGMKAFIVEAGDA